MLDWFANPIPGKSMFNLNLETSYIDVIDLLKKYQIFDEIIKIENSPPMQFSISPDRKEIKFKKMEIENYDWQRDLALLYFDNSKLRSITVYLNDKYSYGGLISGKVGLGDEIRVLEDFFSLEYDDIDEVYFACIDGKSVGLELHGGSCDLSIDPIQKLHAIKIHNFI